MTWGNSNIKAPCMGCVAPKRHLGCHGTCPEYIAWKKHLHEVKQALKNEKENVRFEPRP